MRKESFDITDMLNMDHKIIFNWIDHLKNNDEITSSIINKFLNFVIKHTEAEEALVHHNFEKDEDLYFFILEDDIEHQIILSKAQSIKRSLRNKQDINKIYRNELLELFEMIQQHVFQEEISFLPLLKNHFEKEFLIHIGMDFKKFRKISTIELNHNNYSLINFHSAEDLYFTDSDKFL